MVYVIIINKFFCATATHTNASTTTAAIIKSPGCRLGRGL